MTALRGVLQREHLPYATADSDELNAMTAAQLRGDRLVMVPGGNFEVLGKSLTTEATAGLRDSIASGVNYLGICAGAFFAGASPYNGLNLTGGRHFPFYSAEWQGIRKAAVEIQTAAGETL